MIPELCPTRDAQLHTHLLVCNLTDRVNRQQEQRLEQHSNTATTYSFPVMSCYLLIAFIIKFGCPYKKNDLQRIKTFAQL